jgi:serine/threonine-protein kinase RsbW
MQAEQQGLAPERYDDLASLRATCRRQAEVIETTVRVLANLRNGLHALKAENAALRAAAARTEAVRSSSSAERLATTSGEWIEVRLPLDVPAPEAARIVVARAVSKHVPPWVLERAQLVVTELVTNGLRHSGGSAGASVRVRVGLVAGEIWLEVEDAGSDRVAAQRAPNPDAGDGFGFHIVQTLSECWGVERAAHGPTRVWAQLSDAAPPSGRDLDDERPEARPSSDPAARGARADSSRPRQREPELHVVPEPRAATWSVYMDATARALSQHTSKTEAESAARAQARRRGASRIVFHDRYYRTHAVAAHGME